MTVQFRYLVTTGALLIFAIVAPGACGSSDLLVGDDSHDASRDDSRGDARDVPDGASADSALPDSSPLLPDAAKDTGLDAPLDASCPELVQPAPGFCDGGPYAPTYNANGCINGFACAPVLCVNAGGSCVALSPGSCAKNHFGDATKYSCGGGVGVACCLP